MKIVEFSPDQQAAVIDLIVDIQRNEFSIDITADQQPDLSEIPEYYQRGTGNFWVAVSGGDVVGTVSLLDIGDSRVALRKMFVHRSFRGKEAGVSAGLLDQVSLWAEKMEISEIYLGTTPFFEAAHRFYERNGFEEIEKSSLPRTFPIMEVDTKFYCKKLSISKG